MTGYTEKELFAYTGGISRAAEINRFRFTEGKASGMEGISVRTLGGMDVLLLPDRGLDIAQVSFKGVRISYMSRNGLVSPFAADLQKDGFVRYFAGGMLTTCGLRNTGPACIDDNGEFFPTHGSFSLIQAEEISVNRPDSNTVIISGTIRESALFGHDLSVLRSIRISDAEMSISVTDRLTNNSPVEEEIMLTYHYNFGFPFLQEGCHVVFQSDDTVTPRTSEAAAGMDKHREICKPSEAYKEQVFFHSQNGDDRGFARAELINDKLGISASVVYDTKVLPVIIQWKSMASGDYVLGLEPSNNYVMGRKAERINGTLQKIAPKEIKEYRTELRFKNI